MQNDLLIKAAVLPSCLFLLLKYANQPDGSKSKANGLAEHTQSRAAVPETIILGGAAEFAGYGHQPRGAADLSRSDQ